MRGKILESQKAPLSTFEPKKKKRNPPWTRDELILALDLYLRHRLSTPHDAHQDVAELSAFLGRMGKLLGIASQEAFRNENGVTMKMSNFSRLDPAYTADGKVGLQRGNQDEQGQIGDRPQYSIATSHLISEQEHGVTTRKPPSYPNPDKLPHLRPSDPDSPKCLYNPPHSPAASPSPR
jgi:hypothetical protein